jgi:hypothetical protein
MTVICQKWEESERGWGCRPDGFSLHPDRSALARYVQAYWDRMPDIPPDEYERPCGTAYYCEYDVDFQRKDGVRFQRSTPYPEPVNPKDGQDGWNYGG